MFRSISLCQMTPLIVISKRYSLTSRRFKDCLQLTRIRPDSPYSSSVQPRKKDHHISNEQSTALLVVCLLLYFSWFTCQFPCKHLHGYGGSFTTSQGNQRFLWQFTSTNPDRVHKTQQRLRLASVPAFIFRVPSIWGSDWCCIGLCKPELGRFRYHFGELGGGCEVWKFPFLCVSSELSGGILTGFIQPGRSSGQ